MVREDHACVASSEAEALGVAGCRMAASYRMREDHVYIYIYMCNLKYHSTKFLYSNAIDEVLASRPGNLNWKACNDSLLINSYC
jgi:hypothetical protein